MMRFAVFAAVVATVCLSRPALGETPSAPEAGAVLHERAVEAYRSGRVHEAAELWREATDVAPGWKYAYNAANAMYEDGRFDGAWEYLGRAVRLGMPPEHLRRMSELRAKVSAALLGTRAFIALAVEPEDAAVTLDGEAWPAPRELWTADSTSRVRVSRDGYAPVEQVWVHPVGRRSERTIRLEPLPPPTLLITGEPAGASVALDGTFAGWLPLADPLRVAAGSHILEVTHSGFVPAVVDVSARPGEQSSVMVRLVTIDAPVEPMELSAPGWSCVGGGLGVLAAGIGLLAWSQELAADLDDLNTDGTRLAGMTYDEYATRYEDEHDRFVATRISGAVLTGVGAAAMLTGTVLLILDDAQPDGPTLGVVPTSQGATFLGTVSF